MSESLIDRIKLSEGYKSTVYQCTEGYDTKGYGFAIKDLILSEEISTQILIEKLDFINERLSTFSFYLNSPDEIRDVLVEMVYQMGLRGVLQFKKMIANLEKKDYKNASVEMLDSLWAKQTPNRANGLADIVREHG